MTSATKIFGKRLEKFYSDCAVKWCGSQITARAHTDVRYEALTYSENQALKTLEQSSSSVPTYRLECLTCRTTTLRRYKADAASRLSLNLHQRKVWQISGLLSINVDAFRTSNQFTSSTSAWNSSSEASVSPAELCNPAFEEDDQTDICPIDQAIPVRDSNDNISSESTNSVYKSYSKGSVDSDQTYVRFSNSKTKEKESDCKTVANVGSVLNRERSLSEIFLPTTSAKDSLKRKLRP